MAEYDAGTALLVIDVQNDFADPKGSLYVREGEQVVRVANGEIGRALAQNAPVLYSADWHPPSTPHFAEWGGVWPAHCVRGTWGAEFHPDLHVEGDLIRKGFRGEDGYSAFSVRDLGSGERKGTSLERLLRERGVERLVVLGLATDYCVKETALDGTRIGFPVTVLREGIRAVDLNAGDGRRALEEIQAAGGVLA